MPNTSRFRRAALAFSIALAGIAGAALDAHAAMPPAIDGQALPSLAPMLERVTPAVVNVNSKTRIRVRDPFFDDPVFQRFFGLQGQPREREQQSLGSGVVVDAAKGYVVTNNHVIEGADDIAVSLSDGRTVKAKLVGADPGTDLAVLQIPAEKLSSLPLADSSKLRMGDFVVAVGDPFAIGQSASTGIVSGINRTGLGRSGYQNFIQTDATINPGNSGGALVNLRGELVGINSMIISPSGASAGIGFAIPSDLVADVMKQLIQFGEVKRGALGVETQDTTPELAKLLALGDTKGAVIARVVAGSPADAAGLKPGDVVVSLNGKTIHGEQELHNLEGLTPAGSAIKLGVMREGKLIEVDTVLKVTEVKVAKGTELDPRLTGVQLADAPNGSTRGGLTGVAVTRVAENSRAAQSGLRNGDLIVAVNQREIEGLADFQALVARHPRQLLLTIVRGQNAFFLVLQ